MIVYSTEDRKWDLLYFLEMTPPCEENTDGQTHINLEVLPGRPELTNIETEGGIIEIGTDHENQEDLEKVENNEKESLRKRKRTATDCRVEWRKSISFEKATIIENENKINAEEMLLREKYGELKGVVRVKGMHHRDYKNKNIFKIGKQELMNAKRDITEVIVKEKKQQAAKVRKIKRKKEDDDEETFNIDEVRNQTLVEDIRVSVENSFCSKSYLSKLEAYRKSQDRYLLSLQTNIFNLDEGILKLFENKEKIYKIYRRLRQVQGKLSGINTAEEVISGDQILKKVNRKQSFISIFH